MNRILNLNRSVNKVHHRRFEESSIGFPPGTDFSGLGLAGQDGGYQIIQKRLFNEILENIHVKTELDKLNYKVQKATSEVRHYVEYVSIHLEKVNQFKVNFFPNFFYSL